MPTYDYVCNACGHNLEIFQSMSASPLRKCPECGRLKLKRLIGIGAGVIFKGSGFYETDYRSDEYKKAAKADKEPDGKSKDDKGKDKGKDKGTEGKADTAAKSESTSNATETKKSETTPSESKPKKKKPSS